MHPVYLYLVVLCLNVHAILEIKLNNDRIISCTAEILTKYPEKYNLLIANVMKSTVFDVPVVSYSEKKFTTTTVFGRFNSFIFVLDNIKKLNNTLMELYKSYYWNSRANYLIAYYGNIDEIDDIFTLLWKYLIFNANVIAGDNSKYNVYSFFPYKDDNCAQYNKYELISSCDSINTNDIYPLKIPLNLHGCGVKLMPYVIPPYVTNTSAPRDDPALAGVEITIVNAIAIKMNFTETFIPNPHVHWGYRYKDGSYSMMFKELFDKKIDLIFGFTYGNYSYTFDFDPSFCHLADKSVWFFPTALQIAQWKNLTAIFEPLLWIIIFVMIIINGTAWWIVGRNRENSNEFNKLTLCLMQSFYVLLQGSVIPPKKVNVRLTFGIWSISCLLIFTAHQCQLISILTNPLYNKQMETLEDLLHSKSEFGFYPTILDAYVNTSNWINKAIYTQYETCPLTAECLNRTAFKRDFAVVKNIRQVRIMYIYVLF